MHKNLILNALNGQKTVHDNLLRGDAGAVRYCGMGDDTNQLARTRLAYYLHFNHIDDEPTVFFLFSEEVKARKHASFQGIGRCLEVLTFMLMNYNEYNKYDKLFREAEKANFDCYAGYDRCHIEPDIAEYSLLDGIYLARDLEYKDILAQLVEMWKHDDMTASDRELLIRLNEYLDGGDENERLHRENIAYFIENGSDFEVISAYHKLICHYISLEKFDKAADTLAELFTKADVEKYKGINLFLFILEDSVEIIPHLADGAALWRWAKPFICQLKGRFYGNLYKKSLDAAISQNDEMADEIKADFDRWLELTKLKP